MKQLSEVSRLKSAESEDSISNAVKVAESLAKKRAISQLSAVVQVK